MEISLLWSSGADCRTISFVNDNHGCTVVPAVISRIVLQMESNPGLNVLLILLTKHVLFGWRGGDVPNLIQSGGRGILFLMDYFSTRRRLTRAGRNDSNTMAPTDVSMCKRCLFCALKAEYIAKKGGGVALSL